MIMDDSIKTSECCKTTHTRICWSAIIAGALVGLGLAFLLNIFAMAIGLSAYSSTSSGANMLAIGGAIGLLIGVIVSMGTAGFVAGYFGRFYHCYCHGGVVYGFVTWSLTLILSALLILPLTRYVTVYEKNLAPSVASVAISPETTTVSAQPVGNTPVTNTTVDTKHLACSSWVLFILFFVGAFSSCLGACYGMRCKWENTTIEPLISKKIKS